MKKHLIKSFWTLPDVDAKVAIYPHPEDKDLTVITFLAKGYAHRMVDGEKKMMPRNPDRLKLVEYLLPLLPTAQAVRFGRKSNLLDVNPNAIGVRKLYSKGGNFQFDVVVFTSDIENMGTEETGEDCSGSVIDADSVHYASFIALLHMDATALEPTTGKAIKALDLDVLGGLLSTVIHIERGGE